MKITEPVFGSLNRNFNDDRPRTVFKPTVFDTDHPAIAVGDHDPALWLRFSHAASPICEGMAHGLSVGHEHKSQYMSDHFQKEIAFLGIESSSVFVRAPEGIGCAERFIRTLKENLLWVRHFETIEELRQALLAFRETYNTTWLIRASRVSQSGGVPSETASTHRQGGVGFNPVSQKPRAVHFRLKWEDRR